MGKVIGSTTMTLDGVATVGEWFVSGGEHNEAARGLFERASAMLMGRKSYEGFLGYWPEQEGPWADALNPMPKYVASRTLEGRLEWNSTLIEDDLADGVTRLKGALEDDLVLVGTGELACNALEAGLVDELWFWVHPVVWGEGARPYEGTRPQLTLLGSETFDTGVMLLRYQVA